MDRIDNRKPNDDLPIRLPEPAAVSVITPPQSATDKPASTANENTFRSLQQLEDFIEMSLDKLEARFVAFKTNNSSRQSLRSGRASN